MGFCKPGDPCFNYQLGPVTPERILAWQQEALVTAAECGIDIPAFGDICQQVRNCITGNTHTNLRLVLCILMLFILVLRVLHLQVM